MKILLIAARLFWKRKFANLVLVAQIFISIVALANMFVYITDHYENKRAVSELPMQNTYVFHAHDYYSMDEAISGLEQSPAIEAIARVFMYTTNYRNIWCNLAGYNQTAIERYKPALKAGLWFDQTPDLSADSIPIIVSSGLGLKIGDRPLLNLDSNLLANPYMPSNGAVERMSKSHNQDQTQKSPVVIGILDTPTQYLFPSGSASPEYFSARSIIATDPVIIIRDMDLFGLIPPERPEIPQSNAFIFVKKDFMEVSDEMTQWNKYGEITHMRSLVDKYNETMDYLIQSSVIIFAVFLAVAMSGILSNSIIQSLYNKKAFTVYFLCGMTLKEGVFVEIIRSFLIILLVFLLSAISGPFGVLMLQWMKPSKILLFYGSILMYCVFAFSVVSTGFLLKLKREDLSSNIKNIGFNR